MNVTLIIDTREQKLLDSFRAEFTKPLLFHNATGYIDTVFSDDIKDETQNTIDEINVTQNIRCIEIGDYAITLNDMPVAIIERKSLKDYAASFKDGRHHNRNKLLAFRDNCQKADIDCKIYYVIEGPLNPDYNHEFAGIKYANILASIHDLQIKYGIYIIRTANKQHTVHELKFLCESYLRLASNKKYDPFIGGDESENKVVANLDTILYASRPTQDEQFTLQLIKSWRSFGKIGDLTASKLAANFTIMEWLNYVRMNTNMDARDEAFIVDYRNRVNNFNVNGRKNNAIANMLVAPMTREMTDKLLQSIKGISAKMSAEILMQTQFDELIRNETLANTVTIGKHKLGKKKWDAIYKTVTTYLM